MTPAEIMKLEPLLTFKSDGEDNISVFQFLKGSLHDHLPEVDMGVLSLGEFAFAQNRLMVKIYKTESTSEPMTTEVIGTLYYSYIPVMIFTHGEGANEIHGNRWVLNSKQFTDMVDYLNRLVPQDVEPQVGMDDSIGLTV